jgi:hypothetical protein
MVGKLMKVRFWGLIVLCLLLSFFLGVYLSSPLLSFLGSKKNNLKSGWIDSGWWKEERDSKRLKSVREEYKKESPKVKDFSIKYLGDVENLEQLKKELNEGSYYLFEGFPEMLGGHWKIVNPNTSELLWIVDKELWASVPLERKRLFLSYLHENAYKVGAGETATINIKSVNGEWLGQVSNQRVNLKIK